MQYTLLDILEQNENDVSYLAIISFSASHNIISNKMICTNALYQKNADTTKRAVL